jgi:steroid delta-isomerase-like uncharacterized protein
MQTLHLRDEEAGMSTSNVERVGEFLAAHNRGDLDAMGALFSQDAVTVDRARGMTFLGREGLKTFKTALREAFPDLTAEPQSTIDGGDTVVLQELATGTHNGPLGPIPASGRPLSLAVCVIFRFGKDGLVATADFYWDQHSMLQQIGAVAVPAAA